MSIPSATLTGAGYVLDADAADNYTQALTDGQVAEPGCSFVALKVNSITGGTSPQVEIRNGLTLTAPLVRTVAATNGATIDQRSAPDLCPYGIFLNVTGGPAHFDIDVLWK